MNILAIRNETHPLISVLVLHFTSGASLKCGTANNASTQFGGCWHFFSRIRMSIFLWSQFLCRIVWITRQHYLWLKEKILEHRLMCRLHWELNILLLTSLFIAVMTRLTLPLRYDANQFCKARKTFQPLNYVDAWKLCFKVN